MTALPPGERSGPHESLLRFLVHFPPAVRELDRAVTKLLGSSWEEPQRRRAHEMAAALVDASAAAGLTHVASLSRAIASLLRLRLEDTLSIQDALREKLFELIGLLKELCLDAEESAQG